jgi:hypothetical protein
MKTVSYPSNVWRMIQRMKYDQGYTLVESDLPNTAKMTRETPDKSPVIYISAEAITFLRKSL